MDQVPTDFIHPEFIILRHLLAALLISFISALFSPAFALSLKDCRLSALQQQQSLAEHLYGGAPDASVLYPRHGYILAYNAEYRVPRWVAWHAAAQYRDTPKRSSRWSQFRSDPEFNDVNDKDYAGWFNTPYNFARGHLVPYFIAGGDRDGDGKDAEFEGTLDIEDEDDACTVFEVNALSNITPQFHTRFNGEKGLWYKLETQVRSMIDKGGDYQLFAGTVFLQDHEVMRIGKRRQSASEWKIGVPHGFFKIVIDENKQQAIAFLFDHQADLPAGCSLDAQLEDCIVPVSRIEEVTGLQFFTALSQDEQTTLRASSSRNNWQRWSGR